MSKRLRKGIMAGVLSLSLVMSLASIALATGSDMNGMDMGGHSTTAPKDAEPSTPHEATKEMNSSMPGMNIGGQPSAQQSTSHEATKEMDPNMPGMENNSQSKDEHGETGESEGVNWPVVGSFSAVNLLIITIAGVRKFIKKSKLEIMG